MKKLTATQEKVFSCPETTPSWREEEKSEGFGRPDILSTVFCWWFLSVSCFMGELVFSLQREALNDEDKCFGVCF